MLNGLKDRMLNISSSAKKIVTDVKNKVVNFFSFVKNKSVEGFTFVKGKVVGLSKTAKERFMGLSSSVKRIILASTVAALVLVTVTCGVLSMRKTIVIVDGGNEAKVTTIKRYVADVLAAEGITLSEHDKMNVASNAELQNNMRIEINRAFKVSVTEKGETKEHIVISTTAGAALNEAGYNVKETDRIVPAFNETVSADTNIMLVRLEEEVVEVIEEVPYGSTQRKNSSLANGTRKVVQKGKNGEVNVSYKVYYEDGVEVSREKVDEVVVTEAIDEITEIGTKKPVESYTIASAGVKTSRSGNLSYSKVLSIQATAYDASSCGKSPSHPGYGITATGRQAVYGVVAVDPSVIPLGSRLYIETPDGSYVYGTAIAADTGGAIKGNRIDLCFNTRQEALNFGRRNVNVYVLN